MSPKGVYDRHSQIKSLGSPILYFVNQGVVPEGKTINEQLEKINIKTKDIDYVLLTHLDCDHVNGLKQVADAKNILVSVDELISATSHFSIRYQKNGGQM